MNTLINTFQDLANIDEVYPNEDRVLQYVADRLSAAGVAFHRDGIGNIIAKIPGSSEDVLGICAHVDIAAPLNGRTIIIDGDTIRTDGKGLLGGDDKTSVAALLELADEIQRENVRPRKTLEFIFTVGEENEMNGARAIVHEQLSAKNMLVFDWLGAVNNIILRSPASYALDVSYIGKDAHPGQWRLGRNAGAAMMNAASRLQQGEYAPGVIFTIGMVQIGDARNKIPGKASLKAEMRSYDVDALDQAARDIESTLREVAAVSQIEADITILKDPNTLKLDKDSPLYQEVVATLGDMGLQPNIEETYGRFDGNAFSTLGINAIVLGAAYHNPHTAEETVSITEFNQMYEFIRKMCL